MEILSGISILAVMFVFVVAHLHGVPNLLAVIALRLKRWSRLLQAMQDRRAKDLAGRWVKELEG